MENIKVLTNKYIEKIIDNDNNELPNLLNEINNIIFKNQPNLMLMHEYIKSFIYNNKFVELVLNKTSINFIDEDKILKFLSLLLEEKTKSTVIFSGPEFITKLLYNYSIEEIKIKPVFYFDGIRDFNIDINKNNESNPPIYFNYDSNSQIQYLDSNLGRLLPVNGNSAYATLDFHLPIYELTKKYYSERNIVLTNYINKSKYIHVITFCDLEMIIKSNTIKDYISESIVEDMKNNKVILVLNCVQEVLFIKYNVHKLSNQLQSFFPLSVFENIFVLSGNIMESMSVLKYPLLK